MALINATPDAAPAFDKDLALKLLKRQLTANVNQLFIQMKGTYLNGFNTVWKHPKLTPQEIFDAFGTDARDLVVSSYGVAQALNAIVPNTITEIPPYEYTINDDGTVTVGEKKLAPEGAPRL